MELGAPPAAVDEWLARRMKFVLSVMAPVGAVVIGVLAGLASNDLWPNTGSFTWDLPLFIAVAVAVGIGEFAFLRWFFPRLARATQYRVRRVAVSDGNLLIEQDSGTLLEWPIKIVRVSKGPLVGGWFVVSRPAGRVNESFWAPLAVATAIRAALPA